MKILALTITLGLVLAGTACHDLEHSRAVDNPSVSGKTIAEQVCSNCHGVTGVAVSPMFPKLAGQQREYLVNQLTDLRNRARSDPHAKTFMWGFTHLTDAQIGEIANWFSSQPPVMGSPGNPITMEQGRAIFFSGLPDKGVPACTTCHGQNGEGMGQFPRLAGQHQEYVVTQLLVFQRTDQRPRGATMKAVSRNMSEQEMRQVAAFVEAFPPAAGAVKGTPATQ
ncbi:c-type cytochrome [Burkholderia sp. Ac-20353]|uniref:c-type cytochrome n=1 Tax=Burkholderia sp. Ac-20353 TaxID=2703894 RepID=UPI00197BA5B7|nr:c-type cytochrome [Burkholderia sp. Ac-20353]MBN3789484.1 cytochrome c4 [Burkholderia sp. Ac-20353]